MPSREELKSALSPHITDDAALGVACSLLGATITVDRVLRGEVDAETKAGASQLLFDFTAGLNSNPFWLRHSAYIMPVYTNAISSWLHSYQYAKAEASPDEKLAFLASRSVLAEVAIAVLYCQKGAAALVSASSDLRAAVMKLRL